MSTLAAITIIGPLIAAAIGLLVQKQPALRDTVTLVGICSAALGAVLLLVDVAQNGTQVLRVGGWSPELGIILVADLFAALILPVALLIIAVVEIFAVGQRRSSWGANPELSGPLTCVLTAGVSLAILTGDLFTLFVSFEIILVSSYVLLTHQGKRGQVRAGITYVAMNLLASTLFLFGLAMVYAATGTINMALLADRIPELSDGVRIGIGLWFFVVFGSKAALFPLFSWLPDSYPTAPTTITAVFAGLLTKIGIYSIIRFHTLTGMQELGTLMLIIAGITMVIGALGALAQSDMKRILSFHVISQIGYMLMGLAFFSAAGTAGAILFLIHHMPVKTMLFLVGGLVENTEGSSALSQSGNLASRKPFLAVLFAVPALSLAGFPPFSGFVAKFGVISAGIELGTNAALITVGVALFAGVLTVLSMTKIWLAVFWGKEPESHSTAPVAERPLDRRFIYSASSIALVGTLAISLTVGSLFDLSVRAADDLRNPLLYIGEVTQ